MNPDPTSLDRLHDIVVPPPVPWWPPAPGWYWVLGFLLVLLLVLVLRSLLRWQHNRYRREALVEWAKNEALLSAPATRAAALTNLAELLKRTALSAWPRAEIASLTGSRWLVFLDKTGATTGFSNGCGTLLENAAYDPRSVAALAEPKVREAAELVRHWLKNHRVGGTA